MPQWEASQTTLVGTYSDGAPGIIQRNTRISYDLNNTRLATIIYTVKDKQTSEVKNIYDYKQKTLYTIVGDTCNKTFLDEPFRNACIPQDFSFTWMRTYYGAEGPNLFWVFEYQGDLDGLHYIIQTTWDNNPVMEQILGTVDGVSIFSNSAFVNMTAGIKTPDVFTPPSSCKGVNSELTQDAIPRRLGVFTF